MTRLGCNYGQGFLFSPAIKSSDFEAYLLAQKAGPDATAQNT